MKPSAPDSEADQGMSMAGLTMTENTPEDAAGVGQPGLSEARLRSLLRANQAVVEELDLPVLLTRVVEAAVELVGARYGALGVVSVHGHLEQFIHVGMTPEQVSAIGHLPEGHGLLGALIDDPVAIRLAHLQRDPRFVGFPEGHPPMDAFLGVPVRVRDEVYGNLYLSTLSTGGFTPDDEQVATALAATAGIAIENARLFSETRMRQAWSAAAAEITAATSMTPDGSAIDVLADRVVTLSRAAVLCVLLPTPDRSGYTIATARGLRSDPIGTTVLAEGNSVIDGVIEGGQPRLLDTDEALGLTEFDGLGSTMVLPLVTTARSDGVLLVARRRGSAPFTRSDVAMAATFAGQASLAMELHIARADRARLIQLEDRGRIARDLHDHVIQQLFATGLELDAIARALPHGVESERVERSIANLDATISQIRTIVFALGERDWASIRLAMIDLVNEIGVGFPSTPTLTFSGPVDHSVVGGLADDVLAVAREALTNAARHASATTISVSLSADAGGVLLEVTDDGVGISDGVRRSGLRNLEFRAVQRGGEMTIDPTHPGTRLRWAVPSDQACSAGILS